MTRAGRASFEEIRGTAPDIMRAYDLAVLGYTETEYAVEGTATSYELEGERGLDGRWDVTPGPEAGFRTRFVVRRPSDPARFSGTVVVEWHNVSAGIDAAPDWGFFHRHVAAEGHAWVGVSAQKVGIDGGGFVEGIHLKLLAPERYGQLKHPGDAWSFDMFSQVGALLRLPADENPLGAGLAAAHLLAAGESQSAACLVTYINAIDDHARVFDGFFVHGRPGVGVAIDGVFIPTASGEGLASTTRAVSAKGERIRDDARVPVLVLQSETDVILLGGGLAEQDDSDHVRLWEMAGAAHADTYTVSAGRQRRRHAERGAPGGIDAPDLEPDLRPDGNADQRRAPAALRRAGRVVAPGAVGHRRHGTTEGAPASSRRRGHRLSPRRTGQRTGRHPNALGGRADRRAVGPGPERGVLRDPLRPDRCPSTRRSCRLVSRGQGRIPGAVQRRPRRRHRCQVSAGAGPDGDPRRRSRVLPAASRRLARSSETFEEPTAYASERVRWCLVSACGSLPS